jgi:hypothetical protein
MAEDPVRLRQFRTLRSRAGRSLCQRLFGGAGGEQGRRRDLRLGGSLSPRRRVEGVRPHHRQHHRKDHIPVALARRPDAVPPVADTFLGPSTASPILQLQVQGEVRELFAAHGTVRSLRLASDMFTGACRGFGFVEMEGHEARAAIAALNGTMFKGQPINLKEARVWA